MPKRYNLYRSKSIIFLVFGMVTIAAIGVSAAGWLKFGLEVLVPVGIGAVVIGLMLARSMLPGVIVHIFSMIIGVAWSFWMTTRSGWMPIDDPWLTKWETMIIKLNAWYEAFLIGGVSKDNLMFIFQMSVIVWAMGYLTVWFLFRSERVWQAIVPGGLVLFITLYYAPKDIVFWFLIYVLLSLLLVIRFNLFTQQSKWRNEGVFFQPDISFDFLRDGLIFSVLVIGLAWLAPSPVFSEEVHLLENYEGSWQEFQMYWSRLFAGLNYRDSNRVGAFGSSLSLGGPRALTNDLIMDVQVSGKGRYWRATVYDEYDNLGWRNTDADSAGFGPSAELSLPIFAAREPVTQTYTFYHDGSIALYAMSNPIYLDRSAKATFNMVSPQESVSGQWPRWEGTGPAVAEITYLRSDAAVDQGESYQVVSAASQATVEQLQAAGTNYPAWVTDRYLQLPDTITERTRNLAREITARSNNQFSKAEAIESYLRTSIEYNELIEAPPPNVDKVDYILFETKEGYCDYYASSMIVMLRSLGIPARMAVGFAQGNPDSGQNIFKVVNADAHSWVEVYFPTYGWIEFEPTAAQPVIVRLTTPEDRLAHADRRDGLNPEDLEDDHISDRPENIPINENIGGSASRISFVLPLFGNFSLSRSVVGGGITAIGIVLVVGLVAGVYWWRQQQRYAGRNISNLYYSMIGWARWMGLALCSWQTPFEHALILKKYLPQHARDVDAITNEYVRQTFGKGAKNKPNVVIQIATTHESTLAWRRLRPTMLKATLQRQLRWPRKP